jgi:large subunit ribosomal protein L15e
MAERAPSYKARLIKWHRGRPIVRLESPTNPPRARTLGYKATKDIIVVRVRISKGKRVRRRADLGRKPGKNRKEVNPGAPLSYYAVIKAANRFTNLEPIGVYLAGETGTDKYFEVIMKNNCPMKPGLRVKAVAPVAAKPAAAAPSKPVAKKA